MVQIATIDNLKNTLFNVLLWRMWKAGSYRDPSTLQLALLIFFLAANLPQAIASKTSKGRSHS